MAAPRTSELAVTAWSALAFGALLASFTALRPVRDALILDGRPDDIPWLFTATFGAALVVSPAWSRALANRPKRRLVPRALHVFAASALAFAGLVAAHVAPTAVGRAFYVWSSVLNLFVASVLWSLLADLLGPETARRRYGPISAGGTLGALAGPLLARLLVGAIDVAGVLALSALLLEVAVLAAWRVRRAGEALAAARGDDGAGAAAAADADARPASFTTGLARVARSRFQLAIVGYVLCTATAATFVYLEQAAIVQAAFDDRVARTAFFAEVDLWTQLATLVVQTALAGPLLGWLGPGRVLAVLPLVQGAGIALLALAPSVTALVAAQIASRAATHGLARPARELLFTVVDREDKYHAKNAIDLVGYRFGDFASSWLHRGLVALAAGSAALAVAAVPLVVAWLALAAALGAGFERRRRADARADATPRPR